MMMGSRVCCLALALVAPRAWQGSPAALTFRDPLNPPAVGRVCQVVGLGGEAKDAFAARDYATIDAYHTSLVADDVEGIEQLAGSGRLFPVRVGANFRPIREHRFDLLDRADAWEGRVVGGEHDGERVFFRAAEVGTPIRVAGGAGTRVTLSAIPGEDYVPVFTSPGACQVYLDAYRARTGRLDPDFSAVAVELADEGHMLRGVKAGKAAIVVGVVGIEDHMAAITDPKDEGGTIYYTPPGCVGAK